MTEQEWQISDFYQLLDVVRINSLYKPDKRKLRLFAVGCCYYIWDKLPECSKNTIITVEKHIDGLATNKELQEAKTIACDHYVFDKSSPTYSVICAAAQTPYSVIHASNTAYAVFYSLHVYDYTACRTYQADLFREIFSYHNISKPEISLYVKNFAKSIYDTKDFTALPVLADLIEETCNVDIRIIQHLRENKQHVRGCWALDLLI